MQDPRRSSRERELLTSTSLRLRFCAGGAALHADTIDGDAERFGGERADSVDGFWIAYSLSHRVDCALDTRR